VKRSGDRILTTHMGSLPQSPALHERLMARAAGRPLDDTALDIEVTRAVADIVKRQLETGLTVINDGEQGKSNWLAYVRDRLNGFSGENVPRPRSNDAALFPGHYARIASMSLSSRSRALMSVTKCSMP